VLVPNNEGSVEVERLNPHQFDQFRDFIYKTCGIRVDEKKRTMLSHRIRRRVRAGHFDNFDVYYAFLTSPAGTRELEGFLDAITTNETYFFRTQKHFDWLRSGLLAEWIADERAGRRPRSLRIWSAGCATGAEAYSIAICLAENLARLGNWSLTILGTDISEEVLRAAREGAFKSRAMEAVSATQRRRYFEHEPAHDLWRVRPEITQLVEFKKHNLMQRLHERAFDCIFIRNVLIYFDRDSKQVAVHNLLAALAVGGYLVVGPSEGIYDMLDPLQKVSPLVYRKVEAARASRTAHPGGAQR
jgi:chemotaxis protein methyltransferase CheR